MRHSEKKRFLWFSTHISHAITYAIHLPTHSISSIIPRNDNYNYEAMQVNKEVPKMFNKENLCFLKKKQKYQSENTFEEKQA